MGVLDKLLDAIKLNDEDDDYMDEDFLDEGDDDFDDEIDERPKKKFFEKFSRKSSVDDDLDDFDEEPVVTKTRTTSVKPAASTQTASTTRVTAKAEKAPKQSSKITPMRSSRRSGAANVEVCVIRPTSMENTREIADTLIDNSCVILNLEGLDVELAQRIIDFTLGSCYALGGSLQKISSYIFVLGPYNVDITGDLQNILGGPAPSVRAGY
ncbi:MAG: cell division protein SepF [Blautia sp.]|nr:cell division protein SepF [Blautia sp.]